MLITKSQITLLYQATTSSVAAYTPSSTNDGVVNITAVNTSTTPVTLWLYYSNSGTSTDATTIFKYTLFPGIPIDCVSKFTIKNGYSVLAKASAGTSVTLTITGIETANLT